MINNYLKEGMYLATLDGQKRTNAVVVKIVSEVVTILTDFGNILEMSEYDVFESYDVSKSWIEANHYDYHFPSLKERIDEQIIKLQEAKVVLDEVLGIQSK